MFMVDQTEKEPAFLQSVKKCFWCNKQKALSEFPQNASSTDGLDRWCKECREYATKRILSKKRTINPPIKKEEWIIPKGIGLEFGDLEFSRKGRAHKGDKWGCLKCYEIKPLGEFTIIELGKAPHSWCKACQASAKTAYRATTLGKEKMDRYNKSPHFRAIQQRYFRTSAGNCTSLLASAKRRAKDRGLLVTITLEWLIANYPPQRARCPLLPGIVMRRNRGKQGFDSLTLDRLDSTRGYEPDNVIFCSQRANSLKGEFSADELDAIACDIDNPAIAIRGIDEEHPEASLYAEQIVRQKVSHAFSKGIGVHMLQRLSKDPRCDNTKTVDLFIPRHCPVALKYLGRRIELRLGGGVLGDDTYSIDRIDPSKGYTRSNARVISWYANRLKKNGTAYEFRAIAENLRRIILSARAFKT
jgi:hypothetical protein